MVILSRRAGDAGHQRQGLPSRRRSVKSSRSAGGNHGRCQRAIYAPVMPSRKMASQGPTSELVGDTPVGVEVDNPSIAEPTTPSVGASV